MRSKLSAAVSLWIALAVAGPAAAASTVTLNLQIEYSGPTPVWGLYVVNSLGIGLGAVDVLVEGATGFNLDLTNPGVSPLDWVYSVDPIPGQPWDALIINNIAPGVAIAPAGATRRLGAFLPGDLPSLLPGETPNPIGPGTVLSGTIFDVNLVAIVPISIEVLGTCEYPDPGGCELVSRGGLLLTVPEPLALSTIAALSCLVYVLGGKIRRRSGSVAAPT